MEEKSRLVTIFTTAFYPLMGGSEIAIWEIIRRIQDINFHIITARFNKDHLKEEKVASNLEISRVGDGWGGKFVLPIPFFWFGKMRVNTPEFNEENGGRVVHAYQASYGGGAAWWYKKIWSNSVFILTLQEGKDISKKGLTSFFRNLIIKKADVITAISKYLADYAKRINPKAEIIIIPNGVDIENFSRKFSGSEIDSLKQKLGIKPEDKVIMSASRPVYKNGLDLLIRAVALLSKNLDNKVKLVLVGDDPLFDKSRKNKLKRIAEELGIESNVLFSGIISHADLPLYFNMSDVFVRPSRSEGLGNAFLEAMAAGLPVVGTNVGGIPDFLEDKKTGFFTTLDPEDIASKIKFVLENSELKKQVISNASVLVKEKYDWDNIAEQFHNLYNKYL